MLTIQHLTTGYGKKQVLTDVSFHIDAGEIVLLTGGNGSGKSTILKTIYGFLKPWTIEGEILFDGYKITALPPSQMIQRGIVYVPQKKNVFDDFTVEENLMTSASIYLKHEAKERTNKVFTLLPLLAEMRKRTPFHLSGGERQLLAFGNALVHNPKLVLFDEPFAGVDTANSTLLSQTIQDMHHCNITFIIVEHKTSLLEHFITRKIELELGIIKKNKRI